MKYIYILGLEHSGTTLIDHALSSQGGVLGLGEVSVFFSSSHMQSYIERWGHCDDARYCSCGEAWNSCPFWSDKLDLCGLNSNSDLLGKYAALFQRIRAQYGDGIAIVDSSKSRRTIERIAAEPEAVRLGREDVVVVLACKDCRSFAMSMHRKHKTFGVRKTLQYMNLWCAKNSEFLRCVRKMRIQFKLVLYEEFCRDPQTQVAEIGKSVGIAGLGEVSVSHSDSHIAMGNKDFTSRNRGRIAYDGRWLMSDYISAAYLMHRRAKRLNRELYELAGSHWV